MVVYNLKEQLFTSQWAQEYSILSLLVVVSSFCLTTKQFCVINILERKRERT